MAANATYGMDGIAVTIGGVADLGAIVFNGQGWVGAGLQNNYNAGLATGSHGGVLVQIESEDPDVALVSANSSTPGQPVIEVALADGVSNIPFFVQGVAGAVGPVNVTVSSPRFISDFLAMSIETPVLNLVAIVATHNVSSLDTIGDDQFYVRTAVRNLAGTAIQYEKELNPNSGPLSITFTSNAPAVADLKTALVTGSPIDIELPEGLSRTPMTLLSGGVAALFPIPPSDGTATITATASGFDPFDLADEDITVNLTPATITLSDPFTAIARVGDGLQEVYRMTLSSGGHGGILVRIESSDPATALVAPDDGTPGSAFIDFPMADGTTVANFYVQGVGGANGNITITATHALFTDGTLNLEVDDAVLDLISLVTSHSVNALATIGDDPFIVRSGVANLAGTGIQREQEIAAGASSVTVTLASSSTSVANLMTTSSAGASVEVQIAPGESRSPTTVAAGGAALQFPVPPFGGTTTVAATAPSFTPIDVSDEDVVVSVTPATITLSDPFTGIGRVGAGLQEIYRATLSGGSHGGITLRVESGDPAMALVAPDATTPGAPFIDVSIADLTTTIDFFVQGVSGASGNVTITRISDDPFLVPTAILNVAGTALGLEQEVSPAADLTVTLTSDNTGVAVLDTTVSSGGSVDVVVASGSSRSAMSKAAGGVEADFPFPAVDGSAMINASASDFGTFASDTESIDVSVSPASVTISDPFSGLARVGAGLQEIYRATLSGPDYGGITLRIATSDPAIALIAPDSATAGTSFIDFPIADGVTTVDFYVQGITAQSGPITVTGSSSGFTDGTLRSRCRAAGTRY